MTLRHPERLGPDSDDENEPHFSSEDEDLDQLPRAQANAVYYGPQAAPGALPNLVRTRSQAPTIVPDNSFMKQRLILDVYNLLPPPHVFETEYGPETLADYLRSEVDKIKHEREAVKVKGKQIVHGLLDAYANQSLEDTSRLRPSVPALALSGQSNHGDTSSGPAARRSQRLSRRASTIQPPAAPNNAPATLPTPFSTDPPQQASTQPVDFSHQAGHTRSTRATTFEEYTKVKRNAVRNTAQEGATSPLRAKPRQRRSSKSSSLSGPQGDEGATFYAPASASQLALQDHNHQEIQPGSSSGSGRTHTASLSRRSIERRARLSSNNPVVGAGVSATDSRQLLASVPGASRRDYAMEEEPSTRTSGPSFDYAKLVPEVIPQSEKKQFLSRTKLTQRVGPDPEAQGSNRRRKLKGFNWKSRNELDVIESKQYPRVWKPVSAPGMPLVNAKAGKARLSKNVKVPDTEPDVLYDFPFDEDLWTVICSFLSTQDVKKLRLVSRSTAEILVPIQFRNVVVNFGRKFFDIHDKEWDSRTGNPPPASMFKKFGDNVNQFGIGFEYDLRGLANANAKVIEKQEDAWFGKFTWPTKDYPRFAGLQAIEDLVDHNRPLLKESLSMITKASELGICIDSGHGWLEGPDISDIAVFNRRIGKGSKIFGKKFKTEDIWSTFGRNELFKWAQQNTINATLKSILAKQPPPESDARELRFLDGLRIRDIESFRCQATQYDYDSECHTGGLAIVLDQNDAAAAPNPPVAPAVAQSRKQQCRRAPSSSFDSGSKCQ